MDCYNICKGEQILMLGLTVLRGRFMYCLYCSPGSYKYKRLSQAHIAKCNWSKTFSKRLFAGTFPLVSPPHYSDPTCIGPDLY